MKKTRLAVVAIWSWVMVSALLLHAQPGSQDMTFNPGLGVGGSIPRVNCMILQTNGQIIIGGYFTTFNGVNRPHIARLNGDGSLDFSFDPGVGPNDAVLALALQPDGKILIGGIFYLVNNAWAWTPLARLRTDGSVDISFAPSFTPGASGSVFALALQTDGKVIVGGTFTQISGTNRNYIARLNTNGTLDGTFDPGTGVNTGYSSSVKAIGVQSTGQIIVGGEFTSINGTPRNALARLNTGGGLDNSFDAQIANGRVESMTVTPDDKILIGGSFTSINGYSRNYIARLNADGSLDTSFNPGSAMNYYSDTVALAVQTDGRVVVAGQFSQFNGTNCSGLVRLNTNGTMDLTFNPGSGAFYSVSLHGVICAVSQIDSKTIIGGLFDQFNGVNMNGIVRLNGDNSPSNVLQFLTANQYFGTYLQGTVSNSYRVEYTSDLNTPNLWTPLFNVTLQTNPQFVLDPNPASGERFYRAVQVSP